MICAECNQPATVKGLCRKHYQKAWSKKWNAENLDLARKRRRAWDAANRERANATRRRSYLKRKDKENSASRDYYNKNKSEIFARLATTRAMRTELAKKWRMANPDKVREAAAKYATKYPEKTKALRVLRRARKSKAEGHYTAEQAKSLFRLQRGRCAICKGTLPDKYHEDHIVPLVRGGSNWIDNIQLTCGTCNVRKHAKDPIAFMQERGFLL